MVEDAKIADLDEIYSFRINRDFKVSDDVRFYEKVELEQWLTDPDSNIILIIRVDKTIAGFLYCNILSHHWALLDGLFVRPEMRSNGYGRILLNVLIERLQKRGVKYLSTLADANAIELHGILEHYGFRPQKRYVWFDIFLKEI